MGSFNWLDVNMLFCNQTGKSWTILDEIFSIFLLSFSYNYTVYKCLKYFVKFLEHYAFYMLMTD